MTLMGDGAVTEIDRCIRVLDDALVDQIAAGEVVERPSSIVKELLENSLDAGASSIVVEVQEGGMTLIRVTDDGVGMSPIDAALCTRRHATSKLDRFDDLQRLRTFGFRGEALPSIAAVSRFALWTRRRSDVAGSCVRCESGEAQPPSPTPCAHGTTVEVGDLFFNVPARRKFLKSTATEMAHVSETCLQVALAHPTLRLRLQRGERLVREFLPDADVATRIRQTLSQETLHEIIDERDGIRVHALLTAPERARAGASGLHTFVNRRPIRDRGLLRSIAFAYGSVLSPGRYPLGTLLLDLAPESVDVNVHPQKLEVRFAESRRVYETVGRILAAHLGRAVWSGGKSESATETSGFEAGTSTSNRAAAWRERASTYGVQAVLRQHPPTRSPQTSPEQPVTTTGTASPAAPPLDHFAPAALHDGAVAANPYRDLRPLGQAHRMFVVCEGPDGMVFIDQHAADERLRFQSYRRQFSQRQTAAQRLLFPPRIACSATEAAWLDGNSATLTQLGFECRLISRDTVAIFAVPKILDRAAPQQLLRDVLDQLATGDGRNFAEAIDKVLATAACHASIRAGDPLSYEECVALLRSLSEIDDFAGHCPHGRPVVHRLPWSELQRRVGR